MPYTLPSFCDIFTRVGGILQTPARITAVPCRIWPDIRVAREQSVTGSIFWSHVLIVAGGVDLRDGKDMAPGMGVASNADFVLVPASGVTAFYAVIWSNVIFRNEVDNQTRALLLRVTGNKD